MTENPVGDLSDVDLVNNVNRINGRTGIETAQAELTRRSIESTKALTEVIREANKETHSFSVWFLVLALISMVVGLGQFTIQYLGGDLNLKQQIFAALFSLLLIVMLGCFVWLLSKLKY